MSRLFRLLNLRPKEGIQAVIGLARLFVLIASLAFAATLWMIAMLSWAMSRVIAVRAESEPILVNITQPGEHGVLFFEISVRGFNTSHLPMIYAGWPHSLFQMADPCPVVRHATRAAAAGWAKPLSGPEKVGL